MISADSNIYAAEALLGETSWVSGLVRGSLADLSLPEDEVGAGLVPLADVQEALGRSRVSATPRTAASALPARTIAASAAAATTPPHYPTTDYTGTTSNMTRQGRTGSLWPLPDRSAAQSWSKGRESTKLHPSPHESGFEVM